MSLMSLLMGGEPPPILCSSPSKEFVAVRLEAAAYEDCFVVAYLFG